MNFEKLPSGNWRVQVKLNGHRRSATAPTREAARLLGNAFELELGLGSAKVKTKATLGDLLREHVAEFGYSATKRYKHERSIDALAALDPSPIEWEIREIDVEAASRLMRSLKSLGWIDSRRRTLHGLLSSAWVRAIGHGWAKSNPWKSVDRPTEPEPKINRPTTEQVDAVFAAMNGALALFVRLAAVTGMRLGETAGLQWGDIDFAKSKLTLARSLSDVARVGIVVAEGSQRGKNHERPISLDERTIAMLHAHRVAQVELALAAGTPSPVWIFSHDAGVSPWSPRWASDQYKLAASSVGVSAPIKSLRHYMATTWLTAGVPVLVVSGRLGHKTAVTTLRKYAEYVPGTDAEHAARMAALLAG